MQCRAPFPPQHTLAAIGNGRRIACDVGRQRAWRICGKCGHWNLLGPTNTASLITELAGSLPGMTTDGFAHHTLGEVDVLKVSTNRAGPGASKAGLTSLKLSRFMVRHRRTLGVLAVLYFVLMEFNITLLHPTTIPITAWLSSGTFAVAWSLRRAVSDWLARRRANWAAMVAGVGGFAGLLWLAASSHTWFGPRSVVLLALLISSLWVVFDLVLVPFGARSRGGRHYRLTPHLMRDAAIGASEWQPGVAVFTRDATVVFEGNNLKWVFVVLGGDLLEKASPEQVEQGWMLLRSHDDVSGLLDALDQTRPEERGRHPWDGLPMPWKLAFQIGMVEFAGSAKERDALLAQVREASEVAAIAEELDGEAGDGLPPP